jgi:hypothetical protein
LIFQFLSRLQPSLIHTCSSISSPDFSFLLSTVDLPVPVQAPASPYPNLIFQFLSWLQPPLYIFNCLPGFSLLLSTLILLVPLQALASSYPQLIFQFLSRLQPSLIHTFSSFPGSCLPLSTQDPPVLLEPPLCLGCPDLCLPFLGVPILLQSVLILHPEKALVYRRIVGFVGAIIYLLF